MIVTWPQGLHRAAAAGMRAQGMLLRAGFDHNQIRSTCPRDAFDRTNIQDTRAVKPHRMSPRPGAARPRLLFLLDGDRLAKYGLAITLVASALLLAQWLEEHFIGAPVSLLLCAVMLGGWFGGLEAGVVAAVVAIVGFNFEFVSSTHSLTINPAEIPRLFAFAVSALLIGLLSGGQRRITESLRRARDELADTYRELEQSNEALRIENERRSQAEAALREREQRFRDFAETGSDWFWETGPDHRFTRISGHVERVGIAPATPIGHRRWEFAADLEKNDGEKWRAHIAAHEARQPFRDFVYSLTGSDGSRAYIKTSGKPVFDNEGRFLGYRGVGRDVTAEIQGRQAEKALRRTQAELAHVMRVTTLGELTASIVHEVNQPLSAIATNGEAALRFLQRSEPNLTEVGDAIAGMINDSRRTSEVVQRIRALCRRSELEMVPLDINEIIEEVILLTQRETREHCVVLRRELLPALPPVLGDRVQLQQVVINLLMNAIEAMAGVADRPRDLLVRTQREGDHVLIAVKDSGAGIAPENVDRLFSSFFTTKPGGMGMGLSISRSIVEAHHGKLWASPNAGPGATFQFSLPLSREADTAAVM